jgi:transaldolase
LAKGFGSATSRRLANDGHAPAFNALSVTGLTSNPTIFDHAIRKSKRHDDAIRSKPAHGKLRSLFFKVAAEDLAAPPICFDRLTSIIPELDSKIAAKRDSSANKTTGSDAAAGLSGAT